MKVYHAVVLTTLLYACETWTVYSRHAKQLNHFHMSCLRRLLNVKWQDRIPDTEVLERAGIPSIHTLLEKAQARWAGHVARMPDGRLPKQLLYGELCQGNINTESLEDLVSICSCWRSTLRAQLQAGEKKLTGKRGFWEDPIQWKPCDSMWAACDDAIARLSLDGILQPTFWYPGDTLLCWIGPE